ncbi:MAG: hypothetical protein AAF723_04770, partial [Pseudomonadota bacterium]
MNPIRIANISPRQASHSVWISDQIEDDYTVCGRPLQWDGFSTAPETYPSTFLSAPMAKKFPGYGRWRAVKALEKSAPYDLIISHGPWTTAWTASFLRKTNSQTKHLAFAFNFTDLPTGLRHALMKYVFSRVDHFAIFTDAESSLYQSTFDIPPDKFIRAPWGVKAPIESALERKISEPYIVSLGGEARCYKTLCETAKLCPE